MPRINRDRSRLYIRASPCACLRKEITHGHNYKAERANDQCVPQELHQSYVREESLDVGREGDNSLMPAYEVFDGPQVEHIVARGDFYQPSAHDIDLTAYVKNLKITVNALCSVCVRHWRDPIRGTTREQAWRCKKEARKTHK